MWKNKIAVLVGDYLFARSFQLMTETGNLRVLRILSDAAATIAEAVCHIFACVVDRDLFDTALDFAIRDWARRSDAVRELLGASDERRVAALADMFRRYGYEQTDAFTRARVLYYMQLGYDVAPLDEPAEVRLSMVPHYLEVFTGRTASQEEIDELGAYARRFWAGKETGA